MAASPSLTKQAAKASKVPCQAFRHELPGSAGRLRKTSKVTRHSPSRTGDFRSGNSQSRSGAKLRIEQIVFESSRVFSSEELREQLRHLGESGWLNSIRGRDVYSKDRAQEDLDRVGKFLADRGYNKARKRLTLSSNRR